MRGIPPDADGVWGEISDTLNRQRRRHRRTQEKMRRTINRVSRLTEALEEGILVLRNDRTLDWWNSAATGLLGLRSSDRGSAIINLIRDPDFVEYINQPEFKGSVELASSTQVGRLLKFAASFFGDDEIVLVITDITRLNSLEDMRKEFVGNVSHELRTPLTVMRGYIETLQDSSDNSAAVERAFEQMANQVNRMQALADDLMLLSRLEAEGPIAKLESVNLHKLLATIVAEAEVLSGGVHKLNLTCPDSIEVSSQGDSLRSAFSNIVFNAVHHNPKGATVDIQAQQHADNITVSIKDDGVGIDAAEVPRITERFYRGDNSRNSSTGGTGLGLAIVKHSLNQCGGDLSISSRLGYGATFICRLPVVTHQPTK
jgi:two-component system phosphate regulon sensor histidine kinase PhoR